MTSKKEKILTAALELFANEGFKATSTNKIAKRAEVSEGLIFKHFENKKALLNALMKDGELQLQMKFAPLFFLKDAKEIIKEYIALPFNVAPKEYDFWRLQFMLKWNEEYYFPDKMKPIQDKLTLAFKELEYEEPLLESNLLIQIIDAVSVNILRDGLASQFPMQSFLIAKYNQ